MCSSDLDAESDEAAMSEAGEPEQGQIKSLNQSATAKLELASQITLSLVIGAVVAMVVVFISTIMTKQQPTPTNPVGAMMTNSP